MAALDELQLDLRGQLLTGQLQRRKGETHEQMAVRLLAEQLADAERYVAGYMAAKLQREQDDAKQWVYAFCEKDATGKDKDGEPFRKQYRVFPAELPAFAKLMQVSADKLEKLGEGEIPGPVGNLLRDWQPQPSSHVLGKHYSAPAQEPQPASKHEKPYQIPASQRAQPLPRNVEWRQGIKN